MGSDLVNTSVESTPLGRVDQELVFCRFTQLGLLRLVTTESVAKHETLSQRGAWEVFDRCLVEGGGLYLDEPMGVEIEFRALSDRDVSAPKEWADSYLAGFAAAASLELVTFDRALARRAVRAELPEEGDPTPSPPAPPRAESRRA